MSLRMRDLVGIDAMLSDLTHRGAPPIPIVTRVDVPAASGADPQPIASSPADGDVSDNYRMSSPNRNRGRDDGRMRHRRIKR